MYAACAHVCSFVKSGFLLAVQYGCWELNPGLLQEWYMLFTPEPPLQACMCSLALHWRTWVWEPPYIARQNLSFEPELVSSASLDTQLLPRVFVPVQELGLQVGAGVTAAVFTLG